MNMNAITKAEAGLPALAMDEKELLEVLASSLYPGAKVSSIKMAIGYCKAAGLDPMQKPVHIVPMWDSKAGELRDVILPGIGLYRVQASRSGAYAGITEPEFGPEVTRKVGGAEITFPEWCRVTVKRTLPNGQVADFTAVERWMENYAVKGGKERSVAPNAMWTKRPYGQLAKCAQAQALRMAFPEIGSSPTADEMEGKALDHEYIDHEPKAESLMPRARSEARQPAEDVVDVEMTERKPDRRPETATAEHGRAATVGEKNFLRNKLGEHLAAACESTGIADFESLTADGFAALKDWLKENL
jgi:phage recombination protein Bet